MTASETTLPTVRAALPVWLRNRWGVAAGLAGIYLLLYIAGTYLRWGGPENMAVASDLAYLPLSLFAAVAAWRVTGDQSLDPQLRRAWLLLGICSFLNFMGDVIWSYIEIVLQVSPSPSAADVFYLLFYPVALWGLLVLPGAPVSRGERFTFFLDMAVVMTAAWMLVWYFIISPIAASQESSGLLDQFLAAIYPIADLVMLAGIFWLLLRRLSPAIRSALVLYMAGQLAFVVTDLLYARSDLIGAYVSGGWLDIGWMVAYFLLVLAGLRQAYPTQSSSRDRWSTRLFNNLPLVLPFAAIAFGYGLVIVVSITNFNLGAQVQGLFLSAALLTLLVVTRQVFTLRENMRLNAELRAFSAELEKRVEDRTRELKQSQDALLASQKLASTGALAAGIVHEVGNPLNTIITAVEAMQAQEEGGDKVNSETLKLYLPIISRAVWHAARIVQTLRTFSRGSQPELVPQDLAQVIGDALFLMGNQLERWKNVKLATEFEPGLPKVLCDRNQIAQVLINLLTNARDAMPDGGAITLRLARSSAGAMIEVTDEGMGIDTDTTERVFDPFYTTKGIGKGSGLGLSIVDGIVRAHNGTVSVQSAGPGKGATFTVTLPFIA